MSICISPGGQSLFVSQAPADAILVGTGDGIVFLERPSPGGSWRESRRVLQGEQVSSLLIEPNQGVLLAGTHRHGVFASHDDGLTWMERNRGIEHSRIWSMGLNQDADGVRLYAGTEPAHLYVSENLGETWEELVNLRSVPSVNEWTFPGEPHLGHTKHITFDPRSPDTLYISIEVGGALLSKDGGRSWRELQGFHKDVHRMAIHPQAPDRVYMASGDGIFRSRDGGETWEHLTDTTARIAYPDALCLHPDDPDVLFTAGAISLPRGWRVSGDADARIGRSNDGGRTWEYLEGGLPAHIRGNIEAMSMNTWPGGFALAAGTLEGQIFYSGDGGETWATIASGLPPISKGGVGYTGPTAVTA